MIELGCEVKALQSIHINAENCVETSFLVDGTEISESYGNDRYDFPATIIPSHRFSGTGRQAAYRLENLPGGLGVFDALNCKQVAIPDGKKVELKFKSNVFLDYQRLPHQLTLFLLYNSRQKEVDLRRPDISIAWVSRGEFLIDLTSVVNQINT